MPDSGEKRGSSALITILLALIPVLGGLLTIYLQNQPQLTALQLTATADARIFQLTVQALTAQSNPPTVIVITATPNPAIPTQTPTTASSEAPTATPAAPPTQTPSPTPRPLPGDDLAQNCLSTTLWTPVTNAPIRENNGCWDATDAGIFAYQGLVYSVHQPAVKLVAFRTPLDGDATVSFQLTVNQMTDRVDNAQIDLFFGFGSASSSALGDGEWVVMRKSQDNSRLYLVHSTNVIKGSDLNFGRYVMRQPWDIKMERRGLMVTIYVNGNMVAQNLVPSSRLGDQFWFGYSIPHNSDVEAVISNFQLTMP